MALRVPGLDEDGQPLCLAWNRQRRVDTGIDELLGFVRGIVADDEVTAKEAVALAAWTVRHPDIANDWPTNVLIRRLDRILQDGKVDDDEREDLKASSWKSSAKATTCLSHPPPRCLCASPRPMSSSTRTFSS